MKRGLRVLIEHGMALLLIPGSLLVWGAEKGYDRFGPGGDTLLTVSIIAYIAAVLVYASKVDSKEKKKLRGDGPRMRRKAKADDVSNEEPGGVRSW